MTTKTLLQVGIAIGLAVILLVIIVPLVGAPS